MEPVGLWEWFWLILLFAIPVVNLIAIIVCACGVGKPSLVNHCKAMLIWFLIGLALVILLSIIRTMIQ